MNLQVINESGSRVIRGLEAEDEGGGLSWEQTLRVSHVLMRSLGFTLSHVREASSVHVGHRHASRCFLSIAMKVRVRRQGSSSP